MPRSRTTNEQRAKRRKRIKRKAIGYTLSVFVVLGVIFLGTLVVDGFNYMLDDTDERLEYQELISSLVSLDPAPFTSIDRANQEILLQAAIWSALLEAGIETLPVDEATGLSQLPTINVDRQLAKLYGPTFFIEHKSFTDLGVTFEYNQQAGVYLIPITSLAGSYTARVDKITRASNSRILTVAYIEAGSTGYGQGAGTNIAKYMEYVMVQDGGNYYLYSIRTPELDLAAQPNQQR